MIYPWQTEDWTRLEQLRASWPHALLLHGRAGIGKLQFAQHLAQSLQARVYSKALVEANKNITSKAG